LKNGREPKSGREEDKSIDSNKPYLTRNGYIAVISSTSVMTFWPKSMVFLIDGEQTIAL
jgi:hypothetical protein